MPNNQSRSLVEQLQDEETERLLIKRAQVGDEDAFAELVSRYRLRLHAVVRGILWDRLGDVEDVVQEVLLKVFRNINTYRWNSAFFTWLYTIAHNEAVDFLRKSRAVHVAIGEAAEQIPSPEDIEERLAQLEERREFAACILDGLDELERQVMEMMLDDRDRKEIAYRLNISLERIYSITDKFKERGRALAKRRSALSGAKRK
ncbi:MAG TPA: sigma-70 family RNA polymerase sigma factor [Candidatus Acidoferrum sp.]|jgi:RNA polymerase sigma factor (sigma-70 family)|nr:sigma-70 family RNA polymerase sigma factor [Candidatus Acidoferrum sp.]